MLGLDDVEKMEYPLELEAEALIFSDQDLDLLTLNYEEE